MKEVCWEALSHTEFRLENGLGRMTITNLPSGFRLYRTVLELREAVLIDMSSGITRPAIGTQMHMTGKTVQSLGPVREVDISAGRAALMRICEPPGVYVHPEAGVIRHVGVSCYVETLAERLPPQASRQLARFADPENTATFLESRSASPGLRRLCQQILGLSEPDTVAGLFHIEALALQFFGQTLSLFNLEQAGAAQALEDWEEDAVAMAARLLLEQIDSPVQADLLARKVHMTASRLEEAFRAINGQTLAEYQRIQRLKLAHEWLATENTAIKRISHRLGYAHVSNFTRAYKDFYGESPNRTRTRARAVLG